MPALSDRQADSDTAVLYAAKSTEDRHGSIPDQLAQCRTAAEAEGREVVAEHSDEDATAFKGNRGHGLTAAKDAAIAAAPCELWVQHSDRLARGDGITADHLAEVWFALRRHGVRLRSVQDDSNLEDAIRVVLIGERNWEDSARKSKATQAGKRRAAERGDPQFGIVPDGYHVLRALDEHGRVTRGMELDPERVEVYRLIFDLALRGYSDRAIVLELDRRGYRTQPRKATHRPRPFDASRVAGTLANPTYAGLAVYRGEIVGEGRWPRYISPEDFHRLRAERRARARVDKRGAGRPPEGFVLAKRAVCGECGSPMDVVSSRPRRDGTRKRTYVCRRHIERPQDCAVKPIDAGIVDPAFVSNLDQFLGDIGGWRERLLRSHEAERARMAGEIERAQEDVARCDRVLEAARRRYAAALDAGDEARADGIEHAMADQRRERQRAEARLEAAVAAHDATPQDVSLDPLLDFCARLRDELAGRANLARDNVRCMNALVADYFDRVELTAEAGGVRILPVLSLAAGERILRDHRLWQDFVGTVLIDDTVEAVVVEDPDGGPCICCGDDGPGLDLAMSPAEADALLARMTPGNRLKLSLEIRRALDPVRATGEGAIIPPLRTIEAPSTENPRSP